MALQPLSILDAARRVRGSGMGSLPKPALRRGADDNKPSLGDPSLPQPAELAPDLWLCVLEHLGWEDRLRCRALSRSVRRSALLWFAICVCCAIEASAAMRRTSTLLTTPVRRSVRIGRALSDDRARAARIVGHPGGRRTRCPAGRHLVYAAATLDHDGAPRRRAVRGAVAKAAAPRPVLLPGSQRRSAGSASVSIARRTG